MKEETAMRAFVLLPFVAMLAACGSRTELQPAPGAQLPVAPYGVKAQPTADQLLAPKTQAEPERSVELRKKSEQREDDPFDLPPQD
jgi:ABC-type uncharacterized transport system auxiliary subunit